MRRTAVSLGIGAALSFAAVLSGFAQPGPKGSAAAAGYTQLFISPCGEPYRGKPGDPYPVALWFRQADLDHDGEISKAEFRADHQGFFRGAGFRRQRLPRRSGGQVLRKPGRTRRPWTRQHQLAGQSRAVPFGTSSPRAAGRPSSIWLRWSRRRMAATPAPARCTAATIPTTRPGALPETLARDGRSSARWSAPRRTACWPRPSRSGRPTATWTAGSARPSSSPPPIGASRFWTRTRTAS